MPFNMISRLSRHHSIQVGSFECLFFCFLFSHALTSEINLPRDQVTSSDSNLCLPSLLLRSYGLVNMAGDFTFVLGDRLPLAYDAALAIHSVARGSKTKVRTTAIHRYALVLRDVWVKSFTETHVLGIKAVKQRLTKIVSDYDNKVYKASSRNRRADQTSSSIRSLNKAWAECTQMGLSSHGPSNLSLLDIGKDTHLLTGREKKFYEDQSTTRIGRLSQEVDLEFEEEQETKRIEQEEQANVEAEEESYSNPVEYQEVISSSRRQSVPSRFEEKETQTEWINIRPEIRSGRNSFPHVKDTIASVSTRAGISVAKARIATLTVCEKFYGHTYYLSPPSNSSSTDEQDEPTNKKPRTMKDYESYRYVLPSEKSVNTHKHLKALNQEIEAADALMEKEPDSKATLHYDSTTRSRLEGEWPSLIINVLSKEKSKCKFVRLRALTFAFEDRLQITKLIVETFHRLSAASITQATAKDLWEKVTAFMSDSVTKNLHVPELVAAELKSDHIPYHLLCKAHTCEKLDESNVKTLMEIERITGLKDTIETREPRLISFTRQSKSIVCKAVINALLTIVATGADGKSVSLADEFSLILEEDHVHKKYSLYKERRFTRLGYTAASIFECLPQFQKLLDRTSKKNLLVRACRLYIESDYVRAALKALGYFTYVVTMPYINAVVKCDQNGLVELLPKLFNDLSAGNADCLREYRVEWQHVDTKKLEPTSELDILITQKMLKDAASGVQLQCAREYWEATDKPRVTEIFKLTSEERENLPTENLEPERYMNRVGSLAAQSAAHSNKFFKAKRMRDDLMFSTKPEDFSPEETSWSATKRQIFKRLDAMESEWTSEQRKLYLSLIHI